MCRHKNEGSFSQEKGVYIDPQFIYFLMISLITTLHLVLISRSNVPFFCYYYYYILFSVPLSISLSLSSQETRNRKN